MKRVMRIGMFETNSSSEHALVVFETPDLQDAWENDPEMFLDLRDAEWVGEVGDDPSVFFATDAVLCRPGDDLWNAIMEERVAWHNQNVAERYGLDLADSIEDISEDVVELAVGLNVVPFSYYKGGWGVHCNKYEVDEWSADDAHRFADEGYAILDVWVGDFDH